MEKDGSRGFATYSEWSPARAASGRGPPEAAPPRAERVRRASLPPRSAREGRSTRLVIVDVHHATVSGPCPRLRARGATYALGVSLRPPRRLAPGAFSNNVPACASNCFQDNTPVRRRRSTHPRPIGSRVDKTETHLCRGRRAITRAREESIASSTSFHSFVVVTDLLLSYLHTARRSLQCVGKWGTMVTGVSE